MPSATTHHTRVLPGTAPLCVDVDAPPLPLSGAPDDPSEAPGSVGLDRDVNASKWRIYVLTNHADGKVYVGLTRRSITERMRSHVTQAKRDRRIRLGGLMQAIQKSLAQGRTFTQAFSVAVVATAETKANAQASERHWIERLDSRHPRGLNDMPGGSSVGGVDNARALTVTLRGVRHRFSTIQSAIDWSNEQLRAMGRPPVDAGTVYARLALQWPPGEALGLTLHRDGRGGGTASDLASATRLAVQASTCLGFDAGAGLVWSGRPDIAKVPDMLASDSSLKERVRQTLASAFADALALVGRHRDAVDSVANALIERRALSGDTVADLVARHSGSGATHPARRF